MKEKEIHHVYAKLSGSGSRLSFSYGEYSRAPGFIYKKVDESEPANGYKKLRSFCRKVSFERLHILVYIHGFLGENPWFASLSGGTLHQRIFDHPDHDVCLVISLQWDSGWGYIENRGLAFRKGLRFGEWLNTIHSVLLKCGKPVVFSCLAHSMGNIVFDGLFQSLQSDRSKLKWNQIFLCAADMPSDHFKHGYGKLPSHCRQVHVFNHRDDRTLQVANRFSPFPRMGIFGREDGVQFHNVQDLDVTELASDDTAVGSSFSHHRYFYGSQNVVNYINGQLGE